MTTTGNCQTTDNRPFHHGDRISNNDCKKNNSGTKPLKSSSSYCTTYYCLFSIGWRRDSDVYDSDDNNSGTQPPKKNQTFAKKEDMQGFSPEQ